jgi:Cu+-exporting ATPase
MRCLHCGEPCESNPVRSPDGVFCCRGCESVHAVITAHGLDDYYTCDVNPGLTQRVSSPASHHAFDALDDPEVASRFTTRFDESRSSLTFSIPSMHCSSCLWLLERLWRFDPAIGRTEADVLTRTVRIQFNPARTTPRAVAELLASIGYAPVLDGEQQSDAVPALRRSLYLRIGVAGFAFGNVMLFSVPQYLNGGPLEPEFTRLFGYLNLAFALPVLLYSASGYLSGAWQAVRARTMTLDVPIALGLVVLFGRSAADIMLGLGEGFLDSFAGLVFFLLIGRLFQQRAFERIEFDRSVRSFLPLAVLVEGRPSFTPIDRLAPGDTIVLRAGEVVPADCILLDAEARLDYAFVTGEQAPIDVRRGAVVQAGGRIAGCAVRLAVTERVSQSRLARLWSNPVFDARKAPWLATVLSRFGFWFTVSALALAAAGAVAWWPDSRMALQVATAVLIIACPCAFTLAAPITLGTATGVLGGAGFYLRQPAVALDLSRIDTVIFDKTGTLTTGEATEVERGPFSALDWTLIRTLAAQSAHPVSGRSHAGTATPHGSPISTKCRVAGSPATSTVITSSLAQRRSSRRVPGIPFPIAAASPGRASTTAAPAGSGWRPLNGPASPRRPPHSAGTRRSGCCRGTPTSPRSDGARCSATACASASLQRTS